MSNLKFVFLGLLVLSAVHAEFLFEKNIAANDKFMCLHKMLYRNEKPAVKANAARILSLRRVLSSTTGTETDKNGLIAYLNLQGTLKFTPDSTLAKNIANDLNENYGKFFKSDEFKKMIRDSINYVWETNNHPSSYQCSKMYSRQIIENVKKRVGDMMTLIGNRVEQARLDGVDENIVKYVMFNIMHLFHEDKETALKAYDDYYSANKNRVTALQGDMINAQAVIDWIESIKKRFVENKIIPDPDKERILEPFTYTENSPSEEPKGTFVEPVPKVENPNPKDLEETEPATPVLRKTNEDIAIKDMIIEIQRTYNVEKMLLTYNQLTKSMKEDIDACQLSLKAATARCEAKFGAGKCEPISATMVAPKCPVGYAREGCCRCVADCPAGFRTTNRSFCEMTEELHRIPSIVSSDSNTEGVTKVDGMNLSVGGCPSGFSLNKFICYRDCPAGTTAIGGSTCLKTNVIRLGAPFQWTAGDE